VTTTFAWWSSRPGRLTAVVVCSGRNRPPGFEGPVAGDAQGAAFVGGRDDAEQQLRAGVIQRREPDLIDR
jgi:hypothetical protein